MSNHANNHIYMRIATGLADTLSHFKLPKEGA